MWRIRRFPRGMLFSLPGACRSVLPLPIRASPPGIVEAFCFFRYRRHDVFLAKFWSTRSLRVSLFGATALAPDPQRLGSAGLLFAAGSLSRLLPHPQGLWLLKLA